MSLEQQILERSKEISTDAYTMSVGEMISLYKSKEIDLHPEFQRFFRWTDSQKSKFIESLILGIPIPSLFVSQKPDGTWDVIDGLQRLSTILQLTGDLLDEDGSRVPPLVLGKTHYLSELENMRWTVSDAPELELPQIAKMKIKRARLDLKIVLNTSDASAKYELFQRLNTGGSIATDQEVRNCLLLMINREFYTWFSELGDDPAFQSCLPLSDRAFQERYDLELLARFFALRTVPDDVLRRIGDIGEFTTEKVVGFAGDKHFDYEREGKAASRTFQMLNETLGEDAFRKFDPDKNRPLGPVLISAFEVLALGIGHYAHDPGYTVDGERIRNIHEDLWKNEAFLRGSGTGIRAATRIPITVGLGRKLFAQ